MNCTVQRGHRYRALIRVPWPKSMAATASVVRDRLADAGFDPVTVRALGGGKYEAEGTWPLPDASHDVDYVEQFDDLEAP